MIVEFKTATKFFKVSPQKINLGFLGLNQNLMPVINDTTITLVYEEALFQFFSIETKEITATVYNGNQVQLIGYVTPGFSWVDNGKPTPISTFSITVKNFLTKLENPAQKDYYFRSETLFFIVSKLCADNSIVLDPSVSLPEVVPFFAVEKGKKISEKLFSLLNEYQYAPVSSATKNLKIAKINLNAAATELTDNDIFDTPKISKEQKEFNKIKLNYGIPVEKEEEQLYFSGNGLDDTNHVVPITIRPGQYYPYESDPITEAAEGQVYQTFSTSFAESYTTYAGETRYRRNPNAKLIYSEGHYVFEDWKGELAIDRTEFTPYKASVRLKNNGETDATLNQFTIRGKAFYRQEAYVEAGTGTKEFEQQSNYIYDDGTAQNYALLLSRLLTGIKYNIELYLNGFLIPLSIVHINLGSSMFDVTCVVLSQSYDPEKELYSTKLLSISAAKFISNQYKEFTQIQTIPAQIVTTVDELENNTIPRDVQNVVVKAEKDKLSFLHSENDDKYFLTLIAEISKNNGPWKKIPVEANSYIFNRSQDGYPEREDFQSWKIRLKNQNIYNNVSKNWVEFSVTTVTYGTWLPPTITAINIAANEAGLTFDWNIQPAYTQRPFYGEAAYNIAVKYNNIERRTIISRETFSQYNFNRAIDGYPETDAAFSQYNQKQPGATRLSLYSITITPEDSLSGKKSAPQTGAEINTENYKTWYVETPNVEISASARNVSLIMNKGNDNYGQNFFRVGVKRQEDTEYYRPFTEYKNAAGKIITAYDSEDNYKAAGEFKKIGIGYYSQIMPLQGQNAEPAMPQSTAYLFCVYVENEAHSGQKHYENLGLTAIAQATGAKDIVANAITNNKLADGCVTADKIHAGTITAEKMAATDLAAANVTMGKLSGKGLNSAGDTSDQSNFWNLEDGKEEFRVGNDRSFENEDGTPKNTNANYIHYKKDKNNLGQLFISLSKFFVSSVSSLIKGLFKVQSNNGNDFVVFNPESEANTTQSIAAKTMQVKGSVEVQDLHVGSASGGTIYHDGKTKSAFIRFKNDPRGYGAGATVGGGGALVVGAGESAETFYNGAKLSPSDENTRITSDEDIEFSTNLQGGFAARKRFIFGKDGNATIPGTLSLGNALSISNGGTGGKTAAQATHNLLIRGAIDEDVNSFPHETCSRVVNHSGWTGSVHILHCGGSNSDLAFFIVGGQGQKVKMYTGINSNRWMEAILNNTVTKSQNSDQAANAANADKVDGWHISVSGSTVTFTKG